MKKIVWCILLAVCALPAFSMKNYLSVNMEVPFLFELGDSHDDSQTSMFTGTGISVMNRLFFYKLGINAHASFTLPFAATTIIGNREPDIFNDGYHFPSYIFTFGLGGSVREKMFNLDIGAHLRLLSINNRLADYFNLSTGFYVNPSIGIPLPQFILDIGLSAGMDLYSNSTTTLLHENNRKENYSGRYTMFYFGVFFGICFPSKNE